MTLLRKVLRSAAFLGTLSLGAGTGPFTLAFASR